MAVREYNGEVFPVEKPTYLTAQLRESAPYLRDAGWRETSTLLLAAADEIESLRAQLERQPQHQPITAVSGTRDLRRLRSRMPS